MKTNEVVILPTSKKITLDFCTVKFLNEQYSTEYQKNLLVSVKEERYKIAFDVSLKKRVWIDNYLRNEDERLYGLLKLLKIYAELDTLKKIQMLIMKIIKKIIVKGFY